MIFANYARKSVYRDNSDSLLNQESMARDYAQIHFPGQVSQFLLYSDEDYSGANTQRPDLQRLISDIKERKIDVLIVYQLDRLSRDIRDFANIYAILDDNNVQFVSVKENIDTSTPIGKAMMYITVVFAQMERETIANRVTDNMITLARSGWWIGGNPPVGYRRKRITTESGHKHVILEPVLEEIEYNLDVFNMFLNNNLSLTGLERYYYHNNVLSYGGKLMSTTHLYKILTDPYGVAATPEIYDFFKAKGCQMADARAQWTGKYGVMIYGRSTQKGKTHVRTLPEQWIVCCGHHKPYLSPEQWLKAQAKLKQNKFDKATHHPIPLLKGILRCKCGQLCGVSRKTKVDGSVSSWYRCNRKNRYPSSCDMREISIKLLDDAVLKIFREIDIDEQSLYKYTRATNHSPTNTKALYNQIAALDKKINRLAESLAISENSTAAKYIIQQIEKLDADKAVISGQLLNAEAEERLYKQSLQDAKETRKQIRNLLKDFDSYSDIERNSIAKDIIKSCIWDGETLHITL